MLFEETRCLRRPATKHFNVDGGLVDSRALNRSHRSPDGRQTNDVESGGRIQSRLFAVAGRLRGTPESTTDPEQRPNGN